jgi:hypothetical protein
MGPEWISWITPELYVEFEQCFGFQRYMEAVKDANNPEDDGIIEICDEEAVKWILWCRKNSVKGLGTSLSDELNPDVENYFKEYCAENTIEYLPPTE